jgi:hypothetical protein
MTEGFRKFQNHEDYPFGCPVGAWVGRLDHAAWGKSKNLILYFTNTADGERYWFSVYHAQGYKPRKGDYDFRDAKPGMVFEIETTETKSGNPNLVNAVLISDTIRDFLIS